MCATHPQPVPLQQLHRLKCCQIPSRSRETSLPVALLLPQLQTELLQGGGARA